MIFYDVTSRASFDGKLDEWINAVKAGAEPNVSIVIVGNKIDLASERMVSTEMGKACAERNNVSFFEVSAKEGTCVNEAFIELGRLILKNNKDTVCNAGSGNEDGTASINSLTVSPQPQNGYNCMSC